MDGVVTHPICWSFCFPLWGPRKKNLVKPSHKNKYGGDGRRPKNTSIFLGQIREEPWIFTPKNEKNGKPLVDNFSIAYEKPDQILRVCDTFLNRYILHISMGLGGFLCVMATDVTQNYQPPAPPLNQKKTSPRFAKVWPKIISILD